MTDAINIADIIIPPRLRLVDDAEVAKIAHSIKEIGMLAPLTVQVTKDGRYILVDGAHRLRAKQTLGQETVACALIDPKHHDIDKMRLKEIDANLMRHELNAFDRAKFLSERKAVWEVLYGKPHGGDRGNQYTGGKHSEQLDMFAVFDKETRELTGLSSRTIRRDIGFFNCLTDEVKELIAGSWIAKSQATIKKLAEIGNIMGAEQQARATQAMVDDPKLKTPKNALGYLNSGGDENVMKRDANAIALSALKTKYYEANKEVKTDFILYIIKDRFFNDVINENLPGRK